MPIAGHKNSYLTTREAARILGVSLRTAQLWVENGQLEAWKTYGGHRRISRASVQLVLDGAKPEPAPETPTVDFQQPIKILLVEDDSILIKLYRTVITRWNMPIEVITAGNGIDGLIRIGKDAPDLMITDLSMPGLDGVQMIRLLSASSFRDGLEIVVVTGLEKTQIEALGGLPEDIPVFTKPVPFFQLKAIVDRIAARRATYL